MYIGTSEDKRNRIVPSYFHEIVNLWKSTNCQLYLNDFKLQGTIDHHDTSLGNTTILQYQNVGWPDIRILQM